MSFSSRHSVANFLKAEDAFDYPKHVLDFGADLRFAPVRRLDRFVESRTPSVTLVGEVLTRGATARITFFWFRYAWSPQTRVSFPCSRWGIPSASATSAADAFAVWISLVRLSTPMWAFIPKDH